MTFQEVAVESAAIYYQYLTDNNRGVIEYKVDRIAEEGDCYVLSLSSKLKQSEAVQVKIHNEIYSQEQIKPIEYDASRRILKVRPKGEARNHLAKAPSTSIVVISDLRFLVRRVENWYRANGDYLQLPVAFPSVEYQEIDSLHQSPSEDQRLAIEGALSVPFSYVWGAPGTGKTRFVLARCILSFIRDGKRVLVSAPTNNAVEQTLYGVLSVLEESGVQLEKVLRLGIPSYDFAAKYPSLCEDAAVARKLAEINDQITIIENRISENEDLIGLLPEYRKFSEFESALRRCEDELPTLLERLHGLYQQTAEIDNAMIVLDGKASLAAKGIQQLKDEEIQSARQVKALNDQVKKYSTGILRKLMQGRYESYASQLQKAIKDFDSITERRKQYNQTLDECASKKKDLYGQLEHITRAIQTYIKSVGSLTTFSKELFDAASRISKESYIKDVLTIRTAIGNNRRLLEKNVPKYKKLLTVSEEELFSRGSMLKGEKNDYLAQREEIESNSIGTRLNRCQVLAGTVDTCLSRVPPNGDFRPDHVFLDEAGYCSLIKGVTLLAYHCPVTFLGDHMQLPPVCEMGDELFEQEKYAPVSLWAQSALYAEDVLSKHPYDLYIDYRNHEPACFRLMEKFDLIHTYRFGELLASVLASYVYPNKFYGDSNYDTDIFYINAPNERGSRQRISISECEAVVRYISKTDEKNIGIITPYNNQRYALKTMMKRNRDLDDSILTVHGSQGREWDTVLFSVVDTTNKWFTDSLSQISNGRNVINTAVSRARKKLIIVCDVGYWSAQHRQLIGLLLSVAKEIRFEQ